MNFSAVILAGGKSSRMGQDKARLPVEGQPLIARQIQLVRDAGVREVFISGQKGQDYSAFKVPVLLDHFPDAGPLGGIERALAITTSPLLLVLAVDMPHMTTEMLGRLIGACAEDRGIIPHRGDQLEPLAALYPKSAHSVAAAMLTEGSHAVRDFAGRCVQSGLADYHDLSADDVSCFTNWNTPADLPGPGGPGK